MAKWQLLFIVSSAVGLLLTFVAAALNRPLIDATIAAADSAIGFDWASAVAYVDARPLLSYLLMFAYYIMTPETFLTVLYFSINGSDGRNRELLVGAILGLAISIMLFAVFPTLGPGGRLPGEQSEYARILLDVREHGLSAARFNSYGFIAFPSFHTIMALLLIRAHRGTWLSWPVVVLNGMMLIAIPPIGGHYLSDLLAGVVITGIVMFPGFKQYGVAPRLNGEYASVNPPGYGRGMSDPTAAQNQGGVSQVRSRTEPTQIPPGLPTPNPPQPGPETPCTK